MQVGRVAVFLPHEFVVTFAGVKLIGILWPFPGMRVCPDPQSAFSLRPPHHVLARIARWGMWPFHLNWLISRLPSVNGSSGVLCPWLLFLRLEIVLQLCCIIVNLPVKTSCVFLRLPPGTVPGEGTYLRFTSAAVSLLLFFVKIRLVWSLSQSVSDHFSHFSFSFVFLHFPLGSQMSFSCALRLGAAPRVARPHSRSVPVPAALAVTPAVTSGIRWAVFGLPGLFIQLGDGIPVLESLHLPQGTISALEQGPGPHVGIFFYS